MAASKSPAARFMLLYGLSIFAVRYALGVIFGMAPTLRADPMWVALAGGVGGLVAGIGLGWLGGVGGRSSGSVRRIGWAPAVVLLVVSAGFGGVISLSTPGELPRLPAGDSLPGMSAWNWAELPAVQRVAARDGAPLAYRVYPARPDRAVVLVHGSSSASISMHTTAQALQAVGATVYSISLRGHGGSGTAIGDTSYRDQLDDDPHGFPEGDRPHGPGNPADPDRLLLWRRLRAARGERREPAGLRCLSRDCALHRAGCSDDATADPIFCGMRRQTAQPPQPVQSIAPTIDKRVRAAVALAPFGVAFTASSLAGIQVPTLIYAAELDRWLVPRFHAEWIARNTPRTAFHQVGNAGHFAFLDPPSIPIPTPDGDAAADPPGFDRRALLAKLQVELPDFFDRVFPNQL
jgi:pimeloyl-ACP methyl ester carboxylesterase